MRSLDDLVTEAAAAPPVRGFAAAISATDGLAVIAEIKRRSPSKGDLDIDLDPAALATAYAEGGASCLSVLTDEEFFGGSVGDLQAARAAVSLPVIRKDFTVGPRDVADARIIGADCVLLIAAALAPSEMAELHGLALGLGLDALVEIHDEDELAVAIDVGAILIGVNQRDLVTFQVDHQRAERVGQAIPAGVVKVAESGVRDGDDARRLADAGFDAILVGETLVTASDIPATLRSLRG